VISFNCGIKKSNTVGIMMPTNQWGKKVFSRSNKEKNIKVDIK
jgi:hypothetical protein